MLMRVFIFVFMGRVYVRTFGLQQEDRQTDTWIDRRTDRRGVRLFGLQQADRRNRQTEKRADRQKDRQTNRQTHRQTDIQTDN